MLSALDGKVLDRIEQAAAAALYCLLVARMWPKELSAADLVPAMLLVSEGVILLFLLIRRPTDKISLRPQDWLVAVAATLAPLLVVKVAEPSMVAVAVFLLLFGFIVQLSAKLSLRRSFGLVAANRGVKTSGAYRYVRHPMYLGYMISHVGFLVAAPVFWNFLVYGVCWLGLFLRVGMEERVLSLDPAYQEFQKRVPWRLIPGVY